VERLKRHVELSKHSLNNIVLQLKELESNLPHYVLSSINCEGMNKVTQHQKQSSTLELSSESESSESIPVNSINKLN
jgi:hypothetical protein